MSETKVQTKQDGVEFKPFGESESIKLSIAIIKNYVCIPTKSGQICSDRDAMRFMMLCRSRALNPFVGDCYLQGYDTQSGPEFSLITAHQAFLKRAELNGQFDGKESGVIVRTEEGNIEDRVGDFTLPTDTLLGAWCTVHLKNRTYPQKERISLRAYNKGHGRWKDDPSGMIVKCAESAAMRSAFPTTLGGLYTEAESANGRSEIPFMPAVEPGQILGAEVASRMAALNELVTDEGSSKKPDAPKLSPQDELAKVLTEEGFTFRDFVEWCDQTGNVPGADSLPDFTAVPTAEAKRLLLAKRGLLSALAMMKGANE